MHKLISLLLVVSTLLSCSHKLTKKNDELTGDKISENFINAIGGKENLLKVKTLKMIAEAEVQGNLFMIESYKIAPDKMLVKMELKQGTLTRILNGKKAFAYNEHGKIPITGIDLEALIEEATIFPELYRDKFGHKLEYSGIERINDKELYRVKVTQPNGQHRVEFFDKETGLLYMMIDELGSKSYYDNYKEIGGVKFPHKNKLVDSGVTVYMYVEEIEINPELDEDMFKLK